MKTNEELNVLKEELKALSRKLEELTDDELMQLSGGIDYGGYVFELPIRETPVALDTSLGNRVSERPTK